jgi:subtilisin family serine protease
MVNAVAPEAEIHVYKVLNENNKGPIFSLMRAIFDFIIKYTESSTTDENLRAVINMSLGIRIPPLQAMFNLPAEGQAFRDLLLVADCAEIVVVAASGNNSAKARLPEGANVPANWPEVIGVASSNKSREMACFSNKGNVAAPGGDGVQSKYNPEGCIGATSHCKQDKDCKNAVIGPIKKEDDNTGFAFWNGTSFSAPLVAGLAACVIQKGQWIISAERVRQCIMDGATDPDPDNYMGAGIINIPRTLALCGGDAPCSEEPIQKGDYDKGAAQSAL